MPHPLVLNKEIKNNNVWILVHDVFGEICTAADLVRYKNSQPMFRERRQAFYLRSVVTHRAWRHHTKETVFGSNEEMLVERGVKTYAGMAVNNTKFRVSKIQKKTCFNLNMSFFWCEK